MESAPLDSDLEHVIDEVEEHFAVLFRRVRLRWKEAAASVHPDLQPVGYKILTALIRLGETNSFTLAELLETDKSVVSRQVRMLEDAGLIVSRSDARDGRVRMLSAAPAAIERVRAVRTHEQDQLRTKLRGEPEADVRAFARVLQLLSQP